MADITDEKLTETCWARELDPSFHVSYAINADGHETENLTHTKITDSDEIEGRGDSECGWVAQLDDEAIQLLVSEDNEAGFTIHHFFHIHRTPDLDRL